MDLLESIGVCLQERYTTGEINSLLRSMGITEGLVGMASSKRVYAREKLAAVDDKSLVDLALELGVDLPPGAQPSDQPTDDQGNPMVTQSGRAVFVIHGRNERIRTEFFSFLRAAGLDPLEWSEAVKLTGKGAPYIGEVLDHAFREASAVVVLLTPDDVARLSPDLVTPSDDANEREDRLQPRPNVLFEAGMAFGHNPEHTVLVSVGNPKEFSDVGGRHSVRLNNTPQKRLDLLGRLQAAGCAVRSTDRRDWLTVGDFENGLPTLQPSPPGSSLRGEVSELDTRILEAVAHAGGVNAVQLGARLGLTEVAAEHHLETLEDGEYLHARLAVGRAPIYVLDKKGRALLVSRGLA
jgi:predicted nucleotide-binding protein